MSVAWFAEPELGSPTAMRFLTWLVLRLGRSATRWLLYPLSLYYLAFAPRARRASRAFLRRALGRDPGLGNVLRHFHAYAATLHDRIYLLCGRFEDLEVTVDGAAPLDDILARGRGCVLLGSHLGSFEAVRALGRVKNYPINIVMYEDNSRKVTAVLDQLAPELKARIIAPGRPETMLRIKECLERGEIVGMLGDRPFGSDKNSVCPFLGVPARFPHGPFRLAMALETPIVLFFGLYRGGNRYQIALEALAAPPVTGRDERAGTVARWVERYVLRLEHYAREAPYNWFNFYDFWDESRL